MSETWELTDIPDQVTLTPNVLRAALAILNWTARDLANLTGKWPGTLWANIQDYMDCGDGLPCAITVTIKRILCKQLWFVRSGHGQGVVLKPEADSGYPKRLEGVQ